jgi:hypothetical protein
MQEERPDAVRRCRERVPVEHLSYRVGVVLLQRADLLQHVAGRVQRQGLRAAPAEPARSKQSVQVDRMISMAMRHDDRVDPVGHRRAEQCQQSRQRCVAKIENHPEPVVLQDEPDACPASLRPRATAAQDHEPTAHGCSLSWATRIKVSVLTLEAKARGSSTAGQASWPPQTT